ncbi:sulfite exporter TauE/SafE family protein [Jannaschia sp. LMIT008]|uniref:sulfite exporter TauE/SafE family protein n=1 Tax=Jannaschia maritima TaxID=3032585 RepID=UPI002810BF31|nr:sulfite exporter TauE/SafE family protein [Jannaschia sp. LMIT008]
MDAVLALPGLPWLLLAALTCGVVYGFAGFGTALIFIPVAAAILGPEGAVAALAVMGLGSVVTMLPRAWAQADKRTTLLMVGAATVTMPAGIWMLAHVDPTPLRWAMCLLIAGTLVATVAGWTIRLGAGMGPRLGVGAVAGVLGGATGLLGPVVIVTALASGDRAVRMRANLASFLTILNAALLPMLWVQGVLDRTALVAGAVLIGPYVGGTMIGMALFRPGAERVYRGIAYAVVGAAVVAGLPLLD